jgi:hypothetical protein
LANELRGLGNVKTTVSLFGVVILIHFHEAKSGEQALGFFTRLNV